MVFFWINTASSIPHMCLGGFGPQSLGVDLGTLVKAISLVRMVDSRIDE